MSTTGSLIAIGGATRVASAQCGHFEACASGHKLPPTEASNEFPHYDCYACLEAPCHPVCGGEEFAQAPALRRAYEDLLDAAGRDDADSVIRLASRLPGFVFFNAFRGAVQIRSCGGSAIVASLPVSRAESIILARSLPPASDVQAYAGRFHRDLSASWTWEALPASQSLFQPSAEAAPID